MHDLDFFLDYQHVDIDGGLSSHSMIDKFPSGVVGQRCESVVVKIAILSLFPGLGRNQWSWF